MKGYKKISIFTQTKKSWFVYKVRRLYVVLSKLKIRAKNKNSEADYVGYMNNFSVYTCDGILLMPTQIPLMCS